MIELPFRRLRAPDDTAPLQALFERCSDFFELTEGCPTWPDAAAEELDFLAPGKTAQDTFCLGIDRDAQLIGFAYVIRDYPKEHEWWLGLLLLDPDHRRSGLGAAIHDTIKKWIAANDGEVLWIGVFEQNEAALRFWQREGYVERERRNHRVHSGEETMVILMTCATTATRPARGPSSIDCG